MGFLADGMKEWFSGASIERRNFNESWKGCGAKCFPRTALVFCQDSHPPLRMDLSALVAVVPMGAKGWGRP
jgi:hypothetical protein